LEGVVKNMKQNVSKHPADEPVRNFMLYSECVAGVCDSVILKVLVDCTLSQLRFVVWRFEIRSWSLL
jgi:hypothetical protein